MHTYIHTHTSVLYLEISSRLRFQKYRGQDVNDVRLDKVPGGEGKNIEYTTPSL